MRRHIPAHKVTFELSSSTVYTKYSYSAHLQSKYFLNTITRGALSYNHLRKEIVPLGRRSQAEHHVLPHVKFLYQLHFFCSLEASVYKCLLEGTPLFNTLILIRIPFSFHVKFLYSVCI